MSSAQSQTTLRSLAQTAAARAADRKLYACMPSSGPVALAVDCCIETTGSPGVLQQSRTLRSLTPAGPAVVGPALDRANGRDSMADLGRTAHGRKTLPGACGAWWRRKMARAEDTVRVLEIVRCEGAGRASEQASARVREARSLGCWGGVMPGYGFRFEAG